MNSVFYIGLKFISKNIYKTQRHAWVYSQSGYQWS